MTHEGAPVVFVIHEVAPVRAAIHGARDAPTGSIIGPIRCEAMIISTHNSTYSLMCPARLPRTLAVPAVL